MPDNPNSYSDKLAANIAAQIAFAREARGEVARNRHDATRRQFPRPQDPRALSEGKAASLASIMKHDEPKREL